MKVLFLEIFCLSSLLYAPACRTVSVTETKISKDISAGEYETLNSEIINLDKQISQHPVTALIWVSSTCPCVRRYQSRIENLRNLYPEKELAVYLISSNIGEERSRIKDVFIKRNFNIYPVLVDSNQVLMKKYAAHTTPTVVLLNDKGEVEFKGWIDNERKIGSSGREAYVEDRLQTLLHNPDHLSQKKSPIYGCAITKSLF